MLGRNKKHLSKAKSGSVNTLISKEAKITGDIQFSGVLYIDGYIKGDVIAEELEDSLLTIGQNGYIEGEVKVPHITIQGKVKGDVYGLEHVELTPSAKVDGNVYYKLIEMAMGAEVNGQMVHKDEKPKLLGHHKLEKNLKGADLKKADKDALREQSPSDQHEKSSKKESTFSRDEKLATH